jgi:hypothetical protein
VLGHGKPFRRTPAAAPPHDQRSDRRGCDQAHLCPRVIWRLAWSGSAAKSGLGCQSDRAWEQRLVAVGRDASRDRRQAWRLARHASGGPRTDPVCARQTATRWVLSSLSWR